MPSKQERLAIRKARIAANQLRAKKEQNNNTITTIADKPDEETKVVLRQRLKILKKEINQNNRKLEDYVKHNTVGGDAIMVRGHFVGQNSTVLNKKLRAMECRSKSTIAQINKLEHRIDPYIIHRELAQKYFSDVHNHNGAILWRGLIHLPQYEAEPVLPAACAVEIVERKCVALIVTADSPARCYHWLFGKNIRCDCVTIESNGNKQLSDRSKKLENQGKLMVTNSTLQFQKSTLEIDKKKMDLNRYAGATKVTFADPRNDVS
jgi:hypothetical protein